MRTFSLQPNGVRTGKGPRTRERNKPREGVGGSNGVTDRHFGFQRVATRGDGEHEADRKWGH